MTRTHGSVRGTSYVNLSPRDHGRFGRMFRWLPGETYEKTDLKNLATIIIQKETAHLRGSADAGKPPTAPVLEGPDVVFGDVTIRVPPAASTLLDTAYGEAEPGDENPTIPAGYTYLGQFIDHDLTFDPNSSLQKQNDPDATEDFRTPRFDLDSVYGRGPDDQPYLYKDRPADGGGIRFLLGRKTSDPTSERPGELPRNAEGRSLTGDPRNDENGIICQLQAVFLNFHNRVIDTLTAARPELDHHSLFLEAQRIVRWHYQYIVLNDYLSRVVGEATWRHVYLGGGDKPNPQIEFYKPHGSDAYMPVEFSVAAFRFGHSMVRPSYALRRNDTSVGGGNSLESFTADERFHRIPIFSDRVEPDVSLNGFGPLPDDWEIDWNLFFCTGEMPTEMTQSGPDKGVLGVRAQTDTQATQPGYRIDTQLVDPLAMLPPDVVSDGIPTLAYRNLLRGSAFALPSGQNVARALGLTVLSEAELWADTAGGERGHDFSDGTSNPFARRAPLWFYILKEAELTRKAHVHDGKGGHHLGPVGGRIVAEVLVGIAYNDHTSFLYQDRDWTPHTERERSGFDPGTPITTMFQLINWTTKGTMTLR
jgi:hypothetical protein